jgi:hypothetical protein
MFEKHIISLYKRDSTGFYNIQFVGDEKSVRMVHIKRTHNLPNYTILKDETTFFQNNTDYLYWVSDHVNEGLIAGYTASFEIFEIDGFYSMQTPKYDVRERIAQV